MPAPTAEDRFLINDLFVRYTCALDAGDVETVVGCFAPDGSMSSPAVGRKSGHDQIRDFARRFAAFRARGNQLRHLITNMMIDVQGDRAHVTCYMAVFLTRDGASRLLAPGTYDCRLAKRAGGWVFDERIVTMDHDYELPGI